MSVMHQESMHEHMPMAIWYQFGARETTITGTGVSYQTDCRFSPEARKCRNPVVLVNLAASDLNYVNRIPPPRENMRPFKYIVSLLMLHISGVKASNT